MEKYAFFILVAGAALAAIAYFWLVVRAFRVRWFWGLGSLLPPIGLWFGFRHRDRARAPLLLLLLACVVFAAPYGMSYYERHFVPLAPYEQMVDGERRITLTGLRDFDYAGLASRRDVAVLQMANADVDDRTLQYLAGMDHLVALDLNGTQVTDEGLTALAGLPALRDLRLARTRITDEGFKKHLADKESLRKLDLTGTQVKSKTKRDWKNAKPQERDYVD